MVKTSALSVFPVHWFMQQCSIGQTCVSMVVKCLCNDFTQFCPCVYGEFVGAAHVKTVKDLIYHATDMELSTIQGNPQVWSESSLFAS